MKVSVRSAKEDEKDILYNLLQLYLHDFSEFSPQETDGRGRFTYPYLDHYWQDPQRFPFIIYVESNIAGFALVRTEDDPDTGEPITEMTEFFILRMFRNRGIGKKAAVKLWNSFQGKWRVQVLNKNKRAYPFWQHAISRYTNDAFEEKSDDRIVFLFG